MEENKNTEEILNENDSVLEDETIIEDSDTADLIDSIDDNTDIVEMKSRFSLKVIIPIIVILAALIVTIVILVVNKSNKNDSGKSSDTASSSIAEDGLTNLGNDVAEPSFKIKGKEVDTDDLVFLKINGSEVGFDELRNCYYQFLYNYGPYYGMSEDTFNNASGDELKKMFDTFKESLADYIKGGYVHTSYAKDNNITYDEADKKTAEENIQKIKDEQGDNYKSYLKQNYMTESYLQTAMKNNVIADKVVNKLSIPKENLYKTAKKELYQVKQIYIPFGSEEKIPDDVLSSNSVEDYDNLAKPQRASVILSNYSTLDKTQQKKAKNASKKVADKLYKELQSGTDFDKLMKSNTYDSLYENYSKGILIGKDYEYDEAFLKAALALKENEMSKVVESSSGYHIIMRVPLDKKYIEKNAEYFVETYNSAAVNKVLFKVYENLKVEQTDTFKNFQYGDLT